MFGQPLENDFQFLSMFEMFGIMSSIAGGASVEAIILFDNAFGPPIFIKIMKAKMIVLKVPTVK